MGIFDTLKDMAVDSLTTSLGVRTPDFDPASLNDEIAIKTKWGPVARGGERSCSHRLVKSSDKVVKFRVAFISLFFPLFAMVVGSSILYGALTFNIQIPGPVPAKYIGIALSLFFTILGISQIVPLLVPRVFDLDKGYYWKGRNKASSGKPEGVPFCAITDIHAIQLVQEHVRRHPNQNATKEQRKNFQPYYSFEMNLVLKNGKRCNVIDHSDVRALRTDANELGKFLTVPVWDGTVL